MSMPFGVSEDPLRVVYGGSLSIPICVGSVAVPLSPDADDLRDQPQHGSVAMSSSPSSSQPAPQRRPRGRGSSKRSATGTGGAIAPHRFTHKRFCYIRDGSDLSEDCFYRWLLYNTGGMNTAAGDEVVALSAATPRVGDSAASGDKQTSSAVGGGEGIPDNDGDDGQGHGSVPRKRRRASEAAADRWGGKTEAGVSEDGSHKVVDDVALPRSPSLLYSIVDRVEFIVPNSFSKPRRVLRRPPFVIDDDTWAEHLVEIHVHFLPSLAIPPVSLLHQVLLQQRAVGLPLGLLAKNFGLPKPATIVVMDTTTTTASGSSSTGVHGVKQEGARRDETSGRQLQWQFERRCARVVVSERQDALRVLHPSVGVLHAYRQILTKQQCPAMEALREHFMDSVLLPRCGDDEETDAPSGNCKAEPRSGSLSPSLVPSTSPTSSSTVPALGTAPAAAPPSAAALPQLYTRAFYDGARGCGFLLPAEDCLSHHVRQRGERCVATLEHALRDLRDEQDDLCSGIERTLLALHQKSRSVLAGLDEMHAACLEELERGGKGDST